MVKPTPNTDQPGQAELESDLKFMSHLTQLLRRLLRQS